MWIAVLIELEAQFYKLVTLQPKHSSAHQLVKWSIRVVKVSICYIDSESVIWEKHLIFCPSTVYICGKGVSYRFFNKEFDVMSGVHMHTVFCFIGKIVCGIPLN